MKRTSIMICALIVALALCACKSAGPITDPANESTGAMPSTGEPSVETQAPTSDPTVSVDTPTTGSAWFTYHSASAKAYFLTFNSDGTWSQETLPMMLLIELFQAGLDGYVQHYKQHYGDNWKSRLCEDFHLIEINGKMYAYCITDVSYDGGTYTLDGDNISIYSNAAQSSTTLKQSDIDLEWATYTKLGSISSVLDFSRFE